MRMLMQQSTNSGLARMAIMPPPPTIAPRRQQFTPLRQSGCPGLGLSVRHDRDDDPAVVILGATGTGKSKLSIDIGMAFPSEIINSDKIQVYKGLDITTNKLPLADRKGIPHHLLGELHSNAGELTPAGFRSSALISIGAIRSRRRLPVVAGGSNSYVQALDVGRRRWCVVWVDVEWEVLAAQLDRRVDEMVAAGMVKELAEHYDARRAEEGVYTGIEKAIGVPEFDAFFRRFPPARGDGERRGEREAMEEALWEVKANTRRLAKKQVEKIERMRMEMGWGIRRLDATEAVGRKLEGRNEREVEEAWDRDVRRVAIHHELPFALNHSGPFRREP